MARAAERIARRSSETTHTTARRSMRGEYRPFIVVPTRRPRDLCPIAEVRLDAAPAEPPPTVVNVP